MGEHYVKLALGILLPGICCQPLVELGYGATQLVPSVFPQVTAGRHLSLNLSCLKARQLIVSSHFSFLCSFWRVAGILLQQLVLHTSIYCLWSDNSSTDGYLVLPGRTSMVLIICSDIFCLNGCLVGTRIKQVVRNILGKLDYSFSGICKNPTTFEN